MRVFLDADVLFDSVDDSRTSTLLRRIKKAGHEIILPVSVLGEIILICISEDLLDLMLPCVGQKRKCCLFDNRTVLKIVDKEEIRKLL